MGSVKIGARKTALFLWLYRKLHLSLYHKTVRQFKVENTVVKSVDCVVELIICSVIELINM